MKKNEKTSIHQFIAGIRFNTLDNTNTTVASGAMIRKRFGSLFGSISLLLISRNLSSSVRVIILYFLTTIGIITNKKTSSTTIIVPLSISPAIDQLIDRVRANTIFQKLTFVLRFAGILAMSFCIKLFGFVRLSIIHSLSILLTLSNIAYHLSKIMISQVVYLSKRITNFIIFLLICIVLYSNAYADFENIPKLNNYVPTSISSLIRNTELKHRIPRGLLASIAKVESGNNPLAINVNGKAYFAKDIEDAKEYVISYLRKGVRNIDIGLMQINLRWHGKEFDNVAHMLIPESNKLSGAISIESRLFLI